MLTVTIVQPSFALGVLFGNILQALVAYLVRHLQPKQEKEKARIKVRPAADCIEHVDCN
jgi:hypothetical protein